jgi:hypothetical protein
MHNKNWIILYLVALVMISFVQRSLIIQSLRIPFFPAASTQVSISISSPLSHLWFCISTHKHSVYDYARQWIEASHACIYHLLYLCTWTWIRVTTQMSFLRLISRVAPNPSPPIPELVTWFRAVSWKNFFFHFFSSTSSMLYIRSEITVLKKIDK